MTVIAERVAAATPKQAQVIAEAIEALIRVPCQFWACPGPDKKPVQMATCYACQALWDLRRAGVITREEIAS